MEPQFVPGQRWVNHAELQMGLGTVISVEHRTITLLFQVTGETRTYSKQTAPLTRVSFSEGDKIRNQDGLEIQVHSVNQTEDGLLIYSGLDINRNLVEVPEAQLDNLTPLHGPKDRLLAGMVDEDKWYNLRYITLNALKHINLTPIIGICGCRTDLIPHQLYIANEVSKRFAPRVLLADEVGLGKTIEAGLIIHQQLYTEQIQRVLIVVPENLLHQWLIEMLRRFNLRFSLFDGDRYRDMLESDEMANPLQQEQLVLCSLNTLTSNEDLYQHTLAAGWDMLVVDEAHHLEWSPDHSSKAYDLIAELSSVIKGVLLLTATPEQLGRAGHYARLRLLDPDRFVSFESFLEEEKNYEPIAKAVESLFNDRQPDTKILGQLEDLLNTDLTLHGDTDINTYILSEGDRAELINQLLDHHGTGRVLFRNTRAAISGFPDRQLHTYPLSAPEPYLKPAITTINDKQWLLSPELAYMQSTDIEGHWSRFDPRVDWLLAKLKDLVPQKVLVIAYDKQTVIDLADVLRVRVGKHAAVFHEDMTILERDRAATYFADTEDGTQILICSEVGSEGRNFQFAHHLVLFDLPLNPDMLEQRIGRLDRIGQKQTIHIHVPYLLGSAQELMFQWYQEGLGAFIEPCQTGQTIFYQLSSELYLLLEQTVKVKSKLIAKTKLMNQQLKEDLEKGRDRLLEYNSCRPDVADELLRQAKLTDQQSILSDFMDTVFDCFGVHSEEHSDDSLILSPAENMVSSFPHLPDEGLTITYSRKTALTHENWQYLSWSHPMVTSAMDMVLSYEAGNAAMTTFKHPEFNPGTVLLECHYILESASQRDSALSKLISPQLIRLLINEQGKNFEEELSHEQIELCRVGINRQTARKIISIKQNVIKNMTQLCNQSALKLTPAAIVITRKQTVSRLDLEITRLEELSKINPNIRQEEIDHLKMQLNKIRKIIDTAIPRLDAIRVLVAT